MEKRRILVLGRINDKNLGDSIIVDTCAYALETIAKEKKRNISVTCMNILSSDKDNIRRVIKDYDAVVFPGGGVNSIKFTSVAMNVLNGNDHVEVFFNASGVSKVNNASVSANIRELFNRENVIHITTRGDFATAKKYIETEKAFPVQFILDPAIFSPETYGVKKVENIDELKKAFSDAVRFSRTNTAIIEEFIDGEELSVDIYVEDGGANVLSVSSLDKIADNDKFVIFLGFIGDNILCIL